MVAGVVEAAAAWGELNAGGASELGLGCIGLQHSHAVGGEALAWGVVCSPG